MNFIGVDLHKKSITVCVMDEKRKVLARKTLACTQTAARKRGRAPEKRTQLSRSQKVL